MSYHHFFSVHAGRDIRPKVTTLPLSILLGYGSFKVVNMLRCSEVSAAHTLFIRFVVRSRIIL